MSTGKRIIPPFAIIGDGGANFGNSGISGTMTGTSVITSAVIDAKNMDNVCIEAAWTGTPVGGFSIQGSVTKLNWKDLGLSITGPAGAAGNILLDLNQLSFPFVRLVYTNSSSTGALKAYAGGKAL
jgi:hypothetical protein